MRELRRERGLTLVQLAELTGLSHPFLSQVERGLANFSLPSLRRIAVALETSPVELMAASEALDGADAPPAIEVSRASNDESASDFAQDRAIPLAHGARPFLPLSIECDRTDPGEVFTHAEDEWVTVLSGTLTLELDGQAQTLDAGDSAYYAGGVAHRWWVASGTARLITVKQQAAR